MHLRRPPYIPRVKGWEDTKYFQEEEPISDIDTATSVDENAPVADIDNGPQPSNSKATQLSQHHHEGQHIVPSAGLKLPPKQDTPMPDTDHSADDGLRNPLVQPRVIETPTTGATLVEIGGHLEGQPKTVAVENLKPKLRKKERKRPRDIILRDPIVGPSALEARKLGAFLGYEYRQPVMAKDIVEQVLADDLAKTKVKDYRMGCDGQDRDLTFERRVFLGSGGHMSPPPRPVQQMLRCEHSLFNG